MFLNNLVICSIPILGIVFVLVGLTWSNSLTRLSSKRKKRYSASNDSNSLSSMHVAIHINPFSQLNDVHSYRQRTIVVSVDHTDDDDDEDLIKPDLTSISALSFCENGGIELRLDQDVDFIDNDVDNQINEWWGNASRKVFQLFLPVSNQSISHHASLWPCSLNFLSRVYIKSFSQCFNPIWHD